MADPAIRIVQERVCQTLELAMADYTVFVDRPEDKAYAASELPAINIRIPAVQIEDAGDGIWQTLHRATFHFDCVTATGGGETIDLANQRAIADVMAALHADRSLGGRLQDIIERNISGSEMDGADTGCAIFECEIWFFTPRGDFYTLVGVGGQQFTD